MTTVTDQQTAGSIDESPNGLVLNRYRVEKLLGEGSYGKVKLAIDTRTGEKVAMKVIHKSCIKKPVHVTRLKREVRLMKLLHHPHIVKLYEVAETDKEILLVMEYMEGGELFDYIVTQKKVKEKIARKFFRQILSAVDYCHQSCIIHRDLKPENLLLDSKLTIKIIDFGFVNLFDPEDYLNTFCGSPFYASPEMVLGKQYVGPEVDVWSLGVILFALLSGHLPFRDNVSSELYRKIANAIYTMPDSFSPDVQDIVRRMLTADPKQRISLEELRNHRWVCEGYEGPPDSSIPPRPKISEIDEIVINKMVSYGFEKEGLAEQLLESSKGPAFAVYYLIKEQLDRERERHARQKINCDVEAASDSNLVNPDNLSPTLCSTESSASSSYQNVNQTSNNSLCPSHQMLTHASHNNLTTNNNHLISGPQATFPSHTIGHRQSLRSNYRTATSATLNPDGQPVSGSNTDINGQVSIRRLPRRTTICSSTDLNTQPRSSVPAAIPLFQGGRSAVSRPDSSLNSQIPLLPQIVVGNEAYELHLQRKKIAISSNSLTVSKDKGARRKSLNEAVSRALNSVSTSVTRLLKENPANNTILEEGAPKVKKADKDPRTIKVMFGVDTTSTKPVNDIVTEIERVFIASNVEFSCKAFKFTCVTQEKVEMEVEICKIHKTHMHGLVFKRLKGTIWNYQNICQSLISQWRL